MNIKEDLPPHLRHISSHQNLQVLPKHSLSIQNLHKLLYISTRKFCPNPTSKPFAQILLPNPTPKANSLRRAYQ